MVSYEVFEKSFLANLELAGLKFEKNDVQKINSEYPIRYGVWEKDSDGKVSCLISINEYYDICADNDIPCELFIVKSINSIKKALKNKPNVATDFDLVKDKIILCIVDTEKNKKFLENICHHEFEDLSVYYRVIVNETDSNLSSYAIPESLADTWEKTEEDLFDIAIANNPYYSIHSIEYEMAKILYDKETVDDLNSPLLVAKVNREQYGASCIAYPSFFEYVAKKINVNYFILPSSIHEVMILKDSGNEDINALKDMVSGINREEVSTDMVLNNSIYYYDITKKEFKKVA